ncbi:hypothetical protein [Sphingobacterium deserti]|nr:hypothetical protein [Sphingobacterium deserti]
MKLLPVRNKIKFHKSIYLCNFAEDLIHKEMVGPSIIFYIFFAVPYIFVMYWLVKQDRKKYAWGLAVVTVIAIIGIIVSQKASKVAIQNYQQHQIDAREIEQENRLDSLEDK